VFEILLKSVDISQQCSKKTSLRFGIPCSRLQSWCTVKTRGNVRYETQCTQ